MDPGSAAQLHAFVFEGEQEVGQRIVVLRRDTPGDHQVIRHLLDPGSADARRADGRKRSKPQMFLHECVTDLHFFYPGCRNFTDARDAFFLRGGKPESRGLRGRISGSTAVRLQSSDTLASRSVLKTRQSMRSFFSL